MRLSANAALFQPWPENRLEPTGNPAYEGFGYPSAGYGQSRRKVVGLALPKGENPQLVGWEDPQPRGQRVTPMGTLNPKSDVYPREVIATLMGLGCTCQADMYMRRNLGAIGDAASPEQKQETQSLKEAILRGVVPESFANRLFNKIIADAKANNTAWNVLQKLAVIDPTDPKYLDLKRQQEKSWGEANTAKFYAMFLPPVRDRLIVEIKAGRLQPPDYKYIKGSSGGIFADTANFIRTKLIGDAVKDMIGRGYVKDSTLAGLGEPVTLTTGLVITGVVATLLAAGIVAYMYSRSADVVQSAVRAYMVKKCAEPGANKEACDAAADAEKKNEEKEIDITEILKWGGVGLAALVALQVVASTRAALPASR